MAMDAFDVLAASYETLGAAQTDYEAIGDLYRASGLIDTFDAAVFARYDTAKVRIVAKREQPARRDAWRELGIGLAGGVLVTLFPAVTLETGLRLGGTGGAGLRAMAGQVAVGLGRANLKDVGELLDTGRAGLVVVTVRGVGDNAERAVRRASALTRRRLTVDEALVEQEIAAAAADLAAGPDDRFQRKVAGAETAAQEAERKAESEAAAAEREARQYPAFGPPPDNGGDLVSALEGLARLREAGMLSTAEYEAAKARLLEE